MCASRRHDRGKRYVHGRTGVTSSRASSNRREEHLAVALYNASRGGAAFALPDRRPLEFIDYQMPLKARQGDWGVGKVDLFAVVDGRLPCVVELKVAGESARGDTPLRALLEGLAYCAIVEANGADIASEVADQHALSVSRPTLVAMAPDNYWAGYLDHPRAGRWLSAVRDLVAGLRDTLSSTMTATRPSCRVARLHGSGKRQPGRWCDGRYSAGARGRGSWATSPTITTWSGWSTVSPPNMGSSHRVREQRTEVPHPTVAPDTLAVLPVDTPDIVRAVRRVGRSRSPP